uniref:Uncharacterized protein n=1 Tax=Romanomermis culicivorax TaxID=13658 RepID=A0A915KK35_ROMCU
QYWAITKSTFYEKKKNFKEKVLLSQLLLNGCNMKLGSLDFLYNIKEIWVKNDWEIKCSVTGDLEINISSLLELLKMKTINIEKL